MKKIINVISLCAAFSLPGVAAAAIYTCPPAIKAYPDSTVPQCDYTASDAPANSVIPSQGYASYITCSVVGTVPLTAAWGVVPGMTAHGGCSYGWGAGPAYTVPARYDINLSPANTTGCPSSICFWGHDGYNMVCSNNEGQPLPSAAVCPFSGP